MDVYMKMWNEMRQRLELAGTYSLRMDITYNHILGLMASYEEHYQPLTNATEDLKEEVEEDGVED